MMKLVPAEISCISGTYHTSQAQQRACFRAACRSPLMALDRAAAHPESSSGHSIPNRDHAVICSSGWMTRSPMMNADLERKAVIGSRSVGCMVTIWEFGKRTVWLPSTITLLLSASWETELPPNMVVWPGFRVLPGCTKSGFPVVG